MVYQKNGTKPLYHKKLEKTIESEEKFMRIILEGTEAEFRSMLHSFGIPNEVVCDDGSEFVYGDVDGRGDILLWKTQKN